MVKSLGGLSPLPWFNKIQKYFEINVTSTPNKINENDIIKVYAYNSIMGNFLDYNEDIITATKIKLNNDENNFFEIYDGHVGKGCSII